MDVGMNKQKNPPPDLSRIVKKKKRGNDNKWTTTHQNQLKALNLRRSTVEPGDVGVWVSCARGMEGKAARELQLLFEKYAEKLYGVVPVQGAATNEYTDGDKTQTPDSDDIASLVQKEIASLKSSASREGGVFTSVRLHVECLLFTKTRPPIDPVELAHRICLDAWQDAADKSTEPFGVTKYLNRLTPITASGRACESGVEEVAKQVLPRWFQMKQQDQGRASGAIDFEEDRRPAYSFAIRLSSRHHNLLKRGDVIKAIASLIDGQHHKVDLDNPDKVILVDIFKSTIGMSVVDGDWEELKRYNLSEIYDLPLKGKLQKGDLPTVKG